MPKIFSDYRVSVDSAELLGCPFCGGKAVMERMHTSAEKFWRHRVRCTSCWCQTDWESETKEDAERKWNERASGETLKPEQNESADNGES